MSRVIAFTLLFFLCLFCLPHQSQAFDIDINPNINYNSTTCTNTTGDQIVYLTTVVTGDEDLAGTDALVSFNFIGTYGNCTGAFTDTMEFDLIPTFMSFVQSSVNRFLVPCYDLGEIVTIEIWHDNSYFGRDESHAPQDPSWQLNTIVIRNVLTSAVGFFPCDCWIGGSEDSDLVITLDASPIVPQCSPNAEPPLRIRADDYLTQSMTNYTYKLQDNITIVNGRDYFNESKAFYFPISDGAAIELDEMFPCTLR
eukprot:TRINITY_DN20453_c0_g1::TRINITY_DN20453_c0_g1_i1::g.65::m.65 TRINITY_DN20453_c0_g1::TRINITY_DN20453_c0_g1_i1::g.65  ORF type:complete len:254 (+),score=13.99,sp/Q9Z0T6/PKDRE_MOUSE/31.97/2e-09,PLAT/PF01477.18/1.1e-13,SF-assemblin/PF06705.6/0.23 TRINITY_DN20453_c0_g1_i1:107-868(+)